MSGPSIFDLVDPDQIRRAAEASNQVGVLDGFYLVLLEDGDMLFHFKLLSVFQAMKIAANDPVFLVCE